MGEAARRRGEILVLQRLGPKIDPTSSDPEPTAHLARTLHSMLEKAKQDFDINPVVKFINDKVDNTIHGFGDVDVACKRGCSHCCYVWVSATGPEILSIANIVRARGEVAISKVRAAHEATKQFDFDNREFHPHPCPLLDKDICSIYDARPKACRMAASANAEICARSYHNVTNEGIPTPALHLMARSVFAIAFAVALKRANLPYEAYEFNAGLVRALETPDANEKWLMGQNIFSGLMRDPVDIFSEGPANWMFEYAFR